MNQSIHRNDYTFFACLANRLEPTLECPTEEEKDSWSPNLLCLPVEETTITDGKIRVMLIDNGNIKEHALEEWTKQRNQKFFLASGCLLAATGTGVAMAAGFLTATALRVSAVALFVLGLLWAVGQALDIQFSEIMTWKKDPIDELETLRSQAFQNSRVLTHPLFVCGFRSVSQLDKSLEMQSATDDPGERERLAYNYFSKSEKFWIWHHHTLNALGVVSKPMNHPDSKGDLETFARCLDCVTNPEAEAYVRIPQNVCRLVRKLRAKYDSYLQDRENQQKRILFYSGMNDLKIALRNVMKMKFDKQTFKCAREWPPEDVTTE